MMSRRKFKPGLGPRRNYIAKTTAVRSRRRGMLARQRGYLRTAGFYGRYQGGPNAELKFHDLDIDDAVIASNGVVAQASCNLIAQGVTESTRVGRKCTIKSINWRYNVFSPAAADQADPPSGDSVRVILYVDKQCNGATAAVTDILETGDYQSFRNLANVGRFTILMDKMCNVDQQVAQTDGTSTGSYPRRNYNRTFYKKCNIPIEFNSTTGAITEIRSNNIGVLLVGKNGVAGFESKMRLRFSDG